VTAYQFFAAALLGFGIGFNLANLIYWRLLKMLKRERERAAAISERLDAVQVEHDRIERELTRAMHEARGTEPLPQVLQ